jgi:hypothetical protein
MVFRLEDSVRQAQNLGPAEAPSRYKSRTTKASALVWASEAPKRDFCGSGLRSTTDEEASGMLSLFFNGLLFFVRQNLDLRKVVRKVFSQSGISPQSW